MSFTGEKKSFKIRNKSCQIVHIVFRPGWAEKKQTQSISGPCGHGAAWLVFVSGRGEEETNAGTFDGGVAAVSWENYDGTGADRAGAGGGDLWLQLQAVGILLATGVRAMEAAAPGGELSISAGG